MVISPEMRCLKTFSWEDKDKPTYNRLYTGSLSIYFKIGSFIK